MSLGNKELVLKGIMVNYLQLFIAIASNFVLIPVILRHLGQDAYGLWAIFSSIMVYFIMFDLGINTAVAKYTAEYHAKQKQESINAIISTTLMLFMLIALVILFVSVLAVNFVPAIFNIAPRLVGESKVTFLVMSMNVALLIIAGVFGNVLYGYQRVDLWKLCSIIQLLVNAVFVILFLELGFGLTGVAAAATVSAMALLLSYLVLIRRSGYGVVISPRLFEWGIFREIAPYSLRTFLLGISNRVLHYTGPIIIGIFLSARDVASYDVVFKLCFYSTYVFSVISTAVFPRFSSLYAVGDIEGVRSLYLKSTKISLALMTVAGIFLYFWGHPFIALWVGEENFAGMGVLTLLIVMNLFHALGTPAIALLQGTGRNQWITYSEVVNAGLNLLLSVIFIKVIGLPGIVLGAILAHIFTSFWVLQFSVVRAVRLRLREYLASAVLPPLLIGLVSSGVIWLVRQRLFAMNDLLHIFLNGVIVLLVYAVFYAAFGSTREERFFYYRLFQKG